MLHDLTIVHRRKPNVIPSGVDAPVWETCLRSLCFVSGQPPFELQASDEIYKHQYAYQFLLETVCGLHSPIVGETEVFGQFKTFAQGWTAAQPAWAPFVQRLLNDAKSLRAQHLNGLGTQSYGSWLRKNLRARRIHVIGAGQLAQEILPYLAKQGEVTAHVRTPGKVRLPATVRVMALGEGGFDDGGLVVAANIGAEAVVKWLKGRVPQQIFDLRDNSARDPIAPHAISLQDIFGEIQSTRSRLQPLVVLIKTEIARRAASLSAQEKVRPQGWDDLCA